MIQFNIKCVESKNNSPTNRYGKFIIQPLEPGQGITIGNALRRVLLSDLQGSAISAVRIAGINHEFATIPGIREDVLDILLNLKEVVLKKYSKDVVIGRLKAQGPCIVTAANFDVPSDIRIIDSTQYIATICNLNILEMEFKIENGHGYHIAEKYTDISQADLLHIDAVFAPVKMVNYNVTEIQSPFQVIKDQLILEIQTNGSISPQEALRQAGALLTNLFTPLKMIASKPEDAKPRVKKTRVDQIVIEKLQLPARAYNCLKTAEIHSLADLLKYSQEELLEIKNFGQKSVEDVVETLRTNLGIDLPREKKLKNK